MWRDAFDSEYNKNRMYQKRVHEISNEILSYPFKIRIKMMKEIHDSVIEQTASKLQADEMESVVRQQMEIEKQQKIKEQLTVIQK